MAHNTVLMCNSYHCRADHALAKHAAILYDRDDKSTFYAVGRLMGNCLMEVRIKLHTFRFYPLNAFTVQHVDLFEKIKIRDQTQTKFIDIAAHELRNPIQPILGLAEVMRTNNSLGIKQKEDLLDIIISNAKKLQLFTDNLLEANRIENKTFKLNINRFNLISLLKKTINDVMHLVIEKQIVITNTHIVSVFVEGDQLRLGQVIYNLLTNAIKFSDKGTVITVDIIKKMDEKRNELIVNVKDNGPGIDPKIKEKLFSKFTTKSNMGVGLGLYISKNIVEAHGGKIWAYNNPDETGTIFAFSIPLIE